MSRWFLTSCILVISPSPIGIGVFCRRTRCSVSVFARGVVIEAGEGSSCCSCLTLFTWSQRQQSWAHLLVLDQTRTTFCLYLPQLRKYRRALNVKVNGNLQLTMQEWKLTFIYLQATKSARDIREWTSHVGKRLGPKRSIQNWYRSQSITTS